MECCGRGFSAIVTEIERKKMRKQVYQQKKTEWLVGLARGLAIAHVEACTAKGFAVWTTATGAECPRCVKCLALYPLTMTTSEEGERSRTIVPPGQCAESMAVQFLYE
jgi:hypothetical protein